MTRNELKTKLEEMGVNLELLDMPAVMERLYFMFDVEDKGPYQVEEVEKIVLDGEHYSRVEDAVKLDDEGNIMLMAKDGSHIGRFSKDPFGEGATFVNENYYGAIYYIDKFGMDKGFRIYSLDEDYVSFTLERTDDGRFIIDGLGNKVVADDGRPIMNYQEIKEEYEFGRLRNALPSMRENREFLMPQYPSVSRWYDEKVIAISRKRIAEIEDVYGDEGVPPLIDETIVGIDDLRTRIEQHVITSPDTREGKARAEREAASLKGRMATLQRQNEEYQIQNQRLAKSLEGAVKLNQSILAELQKGAISKKVNRRIIEKYAPELLKEEKEKERE